MDVIVDGVVVNQDGCTYQPPLDEKCSITSLIISPFSALVPATNWSCIAFRSNAAWSIGWVQDVHQIYEKYHLLQLSLCSTSTALATNIYIYYHILQITSEGQLVLDISHSSPRDIQLPGRVKLGGFLSQQFSQQWSIILQMRIDLANHSEVPMYGWDTNSSTKLHFEHNQQHFWIRCRPKSWPINQVLIHFQYPLT